MKKLLFTVLAMTALMSLVSCKKAQKNEDAVAAIKSRGTFVLGLDDSFPPLGFRDTNNEIVGYDIDLAKEVAKRLGLEFVAQPIDWDAKEMELATGKIDCIWNGFTITEDRKSALSFTESYLDNDQVLVVLSNSGINSLQDMKGKIVGLQSGSSAQEAVEDNKEFSSIVGSTILYKDNITALNDLDIRGVDGVVMDSIVANYSITQTGKAFKVIDEALAKEAYGIAFRKNEPELRDAVQAILREMQKDGTVTAISTKWFGRDISSIK